MKPRDSDLAKEIGGAVYVPPFSPLDAPLPGYEGETSRTMQRQGFRDIAARIGRERRVREHGWRRHKQIRRGCPTCAFHVGWFTGSMSKKRKTVEELFR